MMKWCDEAYGMSSASLRYFNVAELRMMRRSAKITPENSLSADFLRSALWAKRESLAIYGDDL